MYHSFLRVQSAFKNFLSLSCLLYVFTEVLCLCWLYNRTKTRISNQHAQYEYKTHLSISGTVLVMDIICRCYTCMVFLQSMAHGFTLTATYAAAMQVRSLAGRSSVKWHHLEYWTLRTPVCLATAFHTMFQSVDAMVTHIPAHVWPGKFISWTLVHYFRHYLSTCLICNIHSYLSVYTYTRKGYRLSKRLNQV